MVFPSYHGYICQKVESHYVFQRHGENRKKKKQKICDYHINEQENMKAIQSRGSEQQPSKSECHLSSEPLDESNSCVEETDDAFLKTRTEI